MRLWGKRVFEHLGEAEAAEMEESCVTLRELGIDPAMTEGTVRRQREMGRIGKGEAVRATLDAGHDAMLKAISAAKGDT